MDKIKFVTMDPKIMTKESFAEFLTALNGEPPAPEELDRAWARIKAKADDKSSTS